MAVLIAVLWASNFLGTLRRKSTRGLQNRTMIM